VINKINSKNLVIGTANFSMNYGLKHNSKAINNDKKKNIISFIKQKKINFFDTSQEYSDSESFLGRQNIYNIKVITKVVFRKKKISEEYVEKLINKSLKKLKVKTLYALLFHNPEDLTGSKGKKIFSFLRKQKRIGKIKKIGVSLNSPDEINIFYKKIPIDIVQLPLNIFDQRLIHLGWLNKLKKENIEIHARSVFLQGLLLMKNTKIPKYFKKFEQNLKEWDAWTLKNRINKIDACLNFILNNKVDKIVLGIDEKKHLKKILRFKKSAKDLNYSELSCNDLKLIYPKLWKVK